MPKITKPPNEEEKINQSEQLEREFQALKQEYSVLERCRTHPTQSKIAKVFAIFAKEYENITADLAVATRGGNLKKDALMFDHLSETLQEYDMYTSEVDKIKTYLSEIQDRIKEVQRDIIVMSKSLPTERQYLERVRNAENTLETLENKLEAIVKKFNTIIMSNQKLRDEIHHLMWSRKNFIGIWNKLIDKLSTGKHIMLDLIEQATIAYDQREEWCTKLSMLRIQGHRDMLHNVDEMRALTRKMDHLEKMEQFYSTKGKKRVLHDLHEIEKMKRQKRQEAVSQKLNDYQEMMREIKEFTRQSKIPSIAQKYVNEEARNFGKFMLVNELITEMEDAGDKLALLQLQVEEERFIHEKRFRQQEQTIHTLTSRMEEISKDSNNKKEELNNINSSLQVLIKGIDKLVRLCKCDKDPLLKLLGHNQNVHEYNVLLYLQLLENRIQTYLVIAGHRNKRLEAKNTKKIFYTGKPTPPIYTIDRLVQHTPCVLCLEHEVVSDVIETIQRPFTREQAKISLKYRLKLPTAAGTIHRLSKCHFPQARRILQKKYE